VHEHINTHHIVLMLLMTPLSLIHILVVDDEPDLLEVSKEFLELDQGISADTATSA
jgi:hypothetical protein